MRPNLKEKEKQRRQAQWYRVRAGTIATAKVVEMNIDALHMAEAFNEFIKEQPGNEAVPDKILIERVDSGLHAPFTWASDAGSVWIVETKIDGVSHNDLALGDNSADVMVGALSVVFKKFGAQGVLGLDSLLVERLDSAELQVLTGLTDVELAIAEIEAEIKAARKKPGRRGSLL